MPYAYSESCPLGVSGGYPNTHCIATVVSQFLKFWLMINDHWLWTVLQILLHQPEQRPRWRWSNSRRRRKTWDSEDGEVRCWPRCSAWRVWVSWGSGEESNNIILSSPSPSLPTLWIAQFLLLFRPLYRAPPPPPLSLVSSRPPVRRRPLSLPPSPSRPVLHCPDLQTYRPRRRPLPLPLCAMIFQNLPLLLPPMSLSCFNLWKPNTNKETSSSL